MFVSTLQHFDILQSFLTSMGGPPCEIDVKIAKIDQRKQGTIKDKAGNSFKAPVFMVSAQSTLTLKDGEDIKGEIAITLSKNKSIDH